MQPAKGGARFSAVTRSVITLGHNLGLTVVAEGVETAEVRQRLVELGCDEAQGHLLARPMDGDDVRDDVHRWLDVNRWLDVHRWLGDQRPSWSLMLECRRSGPESLRRRPHRPHARAPVPVAEVKDEAERHPGEEVEPGLHAEVRHEVAAGERTSRAHADRSIPGSPRLCPSLSGCRLTDTEDGVERADEPDGGGAHVDRRCRCG